MRLRAAMDAMTYSGGNRFVRAWLMARAGFLYTFLYPYPEEFNVRTVPLFFESLRLGWQLFCGYVRKP